MSAWLPKCQQVTVQFISLYGKAHGTCAFTPETNVKSSASLEATETLPPVPPVHSTRPDAQVSQQYSLLGCHTDLRHHLGDTSTSPTKQAGPWVLGRTLKIGSSLVKGRAYKAVVTPVLEYASSIWHPNNINLINRLESVQQKAAWWTPQRCCRISSVNNMLTTLG